LNFWYKVKTQNISGDCNGLDLNLFLEDGTQIKNSLSSFETSFIEFSSQTDNLVFKISSQNPISSSKTCNFDLKFEGWQDSFPNSGFSDTETISNSVQIVPAPPPPPSGLTWVQTTQSDFEAGNGTNVDTSSSPGDVILAMTGGGEELDQSQTNHDSRYGNPAVKDPNKLVAQTFTAGKSGELTKVSLWTISWMWWSSGKMQVELRDVTLDGKPGNNVLATSNWVTIDKYYSHEKGKEYTFTFDTPYTVTAGKKYALVLHESKNGAYVWYSSGNLYASGEMFTTTDGGSTWTEKSDWDLYFKTYIRSSSYSSSGTLESQVFDAGQTSFWQSLEWDATLPPNTDITLEVATSDDGINWSPWQLTSSNSPIDLTGLSPSRYIKWKATLTTSDNTQTPILHEVRVNYSQSKTEDIVINEFLPDPLGDDCDLSGIYGEWVEIYNKGANQVDLSGWYIKDDAGNTIVISSSNTHTGSTIIGAKGSNSEWLVVFLNGCILNNDGDTVYLYDNANQLIDSYSYTGSTQENKSYARYPDGTENWYDPIPTPGKPNQLTFEEKIKFGLKELSTSTQETSTTTETTIENEIATSTAVTETTSTTEIVNIEATTTSNNEMSEEMETDETNETSEEEEIEESTNEETENLISEENDLDQTQSDEITTNEKTENSINEESTELTEENFINNNDVNNEVDINSETGNEIVEQNYEEIN